MKRFILFCLLLFVVSVSFGQAQDPSKWQIQDNPDDTNFEFYSQKGGVKRRAKVSDVRKAVEDKFYPTVVSNILPEGNSESFRGYYVRGTQDSIYKIDSRGKSFFVGFSGRQTKTASSYAALSPSAAIGESLLLPTGEVITKVNRKKWQANKVFGASLPSAWYLINGDTINNEFAIWKNPLGINGVTVDFVFHNSAWMPAKGFLYASDFGAKGDGITNDYAAVMAAINYSKSYQNPVPILFNQGTYRFGSSLLIEGNANAKAPKIIGNGNVVFNFSSSTDTVCIMYGSNTANSLYGGIENINIIGTPTMDGLILRCSGAYACAYNTFHNLTFFNVRNGIWVLNAIGNFANNFTGLTKVEKYFKFGVFTNGGSYNRFNHLFIVQPSGETSNLTPSVALGSQTLALQDLGISNDFEIVQTEDQVRLYGGMAKVGHLSMEGMFKGQHNGSKTALDIAGIGVTVDKLTMIDFNNTVIDIMVNITSNNVALKNIRYINTSSNPLYNLSYSVLPNGGSGILENCDAPASFFPDNPAFESQVTNWDFINLKTNTGYLTKLRNLGKFTSSGLKIGESTPINNSAILEIGSTTKGFLLPRMTTTQRDAIVSPAEGLEIYNLTTHQKNYFNGTIWVAN